ncbi:hypothetical protein XFLAVUS301_17530 [Xanthobacter flavus]|uniref:Uncharacterized protein n=1 Tax=Xanthobacter flavus TaxID=281 RepID=A0A9W6FIW6_XANFL|nr:hypothetical protein XFLAVUS301_17530 [Xanthobacter flavus]
MRWAGRDRVSVTTPASSERLTGAGSEAFTAAVAGTVFPLVFPDLTFRPLSYSQAAAGASRGREGERTG